MKYIFSLIITFFLLQGCANQPDVMDLTKYVDPFIGTGGHGHTFPGATVPFGMVQLSPDNPSKGWDWTSGYNYSDSVLVGFSHTHLSGTGVGDLYDILFMPFVSEYPANTVNSEKRLHAIYSHKNESAEPGYYSVELKDEKIKAELTTTERVGFHKYSFGENKNPQVLLDLGYAQNFDKAIDCKITVIDEYTIEGYRKSQGWATFQPIYFVAKFSEPFSCQLFSDREKADGKEVTAEKCEAVFGFNLSGKDNVLLKVALSSGSIDGARKNMEKEIAHWNFDKVREEASNKWQKELEKVEVVTKDEDAKTIFYTALYHSYLAPYLFTDENDEFYGANGKTEKAEGYQRYTLFSLWDTFRALHPLLTITKPALVDDLVKSMLAFYDESGLLPTWDLMNNETNVMIGYHAVPVIYDAYKKGLTNADPERIYEAFKTSAMQDAFGINYFKKYGYIPSELELEAVSKVLEYSFDDWCIAQLAKDLGKDDDHDYFMQRAEAYKTIFDESTGFMRGRDENGDWVKNFNPLFVEHRRTDYTEANAWQYTFHVLQDIEGLIELYGGEENFVAKLDSLFTISSEMEGNVSPDISGLIGQYAHGNEPCHHVAYLYSMTNQTWKTQEMVSKIMSSMYNSTPNGLIGNDDCGQMSAWYVFGGIGFYPVNPADGKYWFGSPSFDEIKIHQDNGNVFHVIASNLSDRNKYIGEVTLNGKKLERNYITHSELITGGELVFEMTNTPNK